jgi:hypothetical protein
VFACAWTVCIHEMAHVRQCLCRRKAAELSTSTGVALASVLALGSLPELCGTLPGGNCRAVGGVWMSGRDGDRKWAAVAVACWRA